MQSWPGTTSQWRRRRWPRLALCKRRRRRRGCSRGQGGSLRGQSRLAGHDQRQQLQGPAEAKKRAAGQANASWPVGSVEDQRVSRVSRGSRSCGAQPVGRCSIYLGTYPTLPIFATCVEQLHHGHCNYFRCRIATMYQYSRETSQQGASPCSCSFRPLLGLKGLGSKGFSAGP
jgi:hypothetical protein